MIKLKTSKALIKIIQSINLNSRLLTTIAQMNHDEKENREETSSNKTNYEYNLLNIPNFNDADCQRFDSLMSNYSYFDPMKDIVLHPYLYLQRLPKPEEPFPYDGKRCIVAGCKGNDSDEHHEHMLHVYLAIVQFLRISYNLDRVPDIVSDYMQGVLTVLAELLAPTSSTYHKGEIDVEMVKNTVEKLSEQVPMFSKMMVSSGKVSYRAKYDDSKILHIENQEQLDDVLKESPLVMIDFWADWCGPCHSLNPILLDLSHEMCDDITIVKVNVDEQESIAKKFGVESMPTMVFYAGKRGEVNRIVGVKDKDYLIKEINSAKNVE